MRTWSIVLIATATLLTTACTKPSASGPAREGTAKADKGNPADKSDAAGGAAEAASPEAPPTTAKAQGAPVDDMSKLQPLPDGTFNGRIMGDRVSGEITLVILDGVVISAKADLIRKKRVALELKPRSAADSRRLSLGGRKDGSFMSMLGTFVDGERAAGTFTGTVTKKKVSGRWYAIRR